MTILGDAAPTRQTETSTPVAGVYSSVAELIGNTPLVELHALTAGLESRVLVKLENRNPGGSSKDRVALNIVRRAESSGELPPGGTIVECTSGNTGIGLALVGRLTGHPVVIVHSPAISPEKRAILAAYGARLVEADWELGPEHPDNARAVADRIAAEIPGGWRASQFDNDANPAAHYASTGPEIWEQTGGTVTHFVAGMGTSGTVTGTGRYLKDISGGAVKVTGVDPVGSTYSGAAPGPILVEGVGTTWPITNWPGFFDHAVTDEVRVIDNERVFDTVRRLALDEALLLGPSSGLAIAAAIDVAREAPAGSVVVVIAPDGGTNYLSTAFNDAWRERAAL